MSNQEGIKPILNIIEKVESVRKCTSAYDTSKEMWAEALSLAQQKNIGVELVRRVMKEDLAREAEQIEWATEQVARSAQYTAEIERLLLESEQWWEAE